MTFEFLVVALNFFVCFVWFADVETVAENLLKFVPDKEALFQLRKNEFQARVNN